jgi:histone H2A
MARKGEAYPSRPRSTSFKAGPQFTVGRIARFIKFGRCAERVGAETTVYLTDVLENLAADVL